MNPVKQFIASIVFLIAGPAIAAPEAFLMWRPDTNSQYQRKPFTPQLNYVLSFDAAGLPIMVPFEVVSGSGDVVGPAGATLNRVAVFTNASGKVIGDSGFSIADLRNASNLNAGTLAAARLPFPETTLLGGVKRNTGTPGQYVTGINAAGELLFDTPAGGGGGVPDTRIPYGDGSGEFTSEVPFYYDPALNSLYVGQLFLGSNSGDPADGGVNISNDTDGQLFFQGYGDGFNENVYLNLDDSENEAWWNSSSGVNKMSFAFPLHTPVNAYNATNWNGSTRVPTQDDVRDEFENRAPKASPSFTGAVTIGGNVVNTPSTMASTVVDTSKQYQTRAVAGNETWTFGVAPSTAGQEWGVEVANTTGAQRTVTIPSSIDGNDPAAGSMTSFTIPNNGRRTLQWRYNGTSSILFISGSGGTADEVAWANITGKPTTITGYGITDAQPLDSDLTDIASVGTTAYGRGLLDDPGAAAFTGTGTYFGGGRYFGAMSATATLGLTMNAGDTSHFFLTVSGTQTLNFPSSRRSATSGGTTSSLSLSEGYQVVSFFYDGTNYWVLPDISQLVAIATDVSGLGSGVATFLGTPSSANLAAALTDEEGSGGGFVRAASPTLTTPNLGTPSAATLTNATGLPIATGVSGLGANVATALATPSSANLRSAVTDEVGSGSLMFTRTGVRRTFYVGAAAMIPRTTNGPARGTVETGTNDIMFESLDFDQTTEEGAGFWCALPRTFDAGTVTARFHWAATTGSGTVKWDIAARGFGNDDQLDQALGTEQTASADTLEATGSVHLSATTPALTIGGTVGANIPVYWQITRDVGGDTLSADALLLGVTIEYTESATEPAAQ